jgi:3-methyl-2-oxobutanoate hydroxymethyltransferase
MAKQYLNLFPQLTKAVAAYVQEVQKGAFPAEEHGFALDPEVVSGLRI